MTQTPDKLKYLPLSVLAVLCLTVACCLGCRKDRLNHAKGLLENGDFLSARKIYSRMAESRPEDFTVRYGLGMSWCAEAIYKTEIGIAEPKDWYPAIYEMTVATHLDTGKEVRGTLAIFHYNLGASFKRTGNREEAVRSIQHALSCDSTLLKAYNLLGSLYQEQGDLDNADLSYRHALLLKPDYAPAHFNRGTLAWARGDFASAEQCFQDAVTCKPQNTYFSGWLEKARKASAAGAGGR
jgi:tetratricopeptide (TPR) repeat protein